MASLTRSQLKTSSNNTYTTNGAGDIDASEVRTFNNDLIDSLITNDATSSMNVLTSISASYATIAGGVVGGVPSLASLNAFTQSQDSKNSTLASYTASNDSTNTAQNSRLTNLESTSASVNTSIANLNTFSASNGNTSLNSFTSSANSRLTSLESATASYANSASVAAVDASQQSQINSLIASTGSYALTSSIVVLTSLNDFTASQNTKNTTLENVTSSLIASQSLDNTKWNTLGSLTGSYATTGSNIFVGNQTITGSLIVQGTGAISNKVTIPNGTSNIRIAIDQPIVIERSSTSSGVGFDILGSNPRVLFTDTLTSYATQIYNSSNDFYLGKSNGKFISFPNITTPTTIIYNKLDVSGSVSITGSLTASLQEGYVLVGNSSNRTVAVATSSFASTNDLSSLNAFTSSQLSINSGVNSFTASASSSLNSLNQNSSSQQSQINSLIAATGSYASTSSIVVLTSLNDFTSSQNTKNTTLASYTGSNDTKWSNLGSQSGSFVTESETASFARTNVDNNFTANQTFTNITAVSASFTYVQTTYETSSVIYSSGSNQFGDELSDIQTLSGSVRVQGNLTVNGTPVQTSSVDISSLNAFTSSQNTKNSTLATYTASVDSSLTNINSFTASNGNTSLNSYTASNDTKWSTLGGQTGSYVTSAITASSLTTASFSVNTLTFTKGDGTTFGIVIPDVSGSDVPAGTISGSSQITALGFVSSSVTASSIVTASVVDDDITFTKGDGSQFTIQIATGSFAATSSLAQDALDIVVNVKNTTGAQLNKGTVVRIIGATGDNPLIGTASWTDDDNSANTLGFVVTNIPNDGFGRVMTQGTLLSVNTDPTLGYTAGQLVYLSGSGQYTNVKPPAPYHEVRLGQVLRAQQNNGSIYVLVQNGYELTELHDVDINTGSLANNDLLAYDSASTQWVNRTVSGVGATTTSSFNAYTSSNDQKVNSLVAATSSYATTGANTFNGNQTLNGSNKIGFGTTPNDVYINSPFNGVTNVNLDIINYSTGGGTTNILANNAVSIQSINDKVNITGKTGVDVYGNTFISGALNVTGSLTASLQEGYVWVGDSTGKTVTVATSSFGGGGGTIPAGTVSSSAQIVAYNIFATTGSNVFTGEQTLVDAAGNTVTLDDISGSLVLVSKGVTSGSAGLSHITASANNQVNIIFKNNSQLSGSTVISGSNNILQSPPTPTAGFRRQANASNIMITGQIPEVSSSVAFPVVFSNNYANSIMRLRGPVSSSTWGFANNIVNGNFNVGSADATSANQAIAGGAMNNNVLLSAVNYNAYTTPLVAQANFSNNLVTGVTTLTAFSSSIQSANNIFNGNTFTVNNRYFGTSALPAAQRLQLVYNVLGGINSSTLTAEGSNTAAGAAREVIANTTNGSGLSLGVVLSGDNSSLLSTLIHGSNLTVTGSSANNNYNTAGGAFIGRNNDRTGTKASSAETIFAVGTGTSNAARKTGFLIDSGSNTFVDGTFNVSGPTSFNGVVNITGSLTSSLTEGYVWVGGAGNISTLVATSSFAGGVTSAITASSLITASVNLNTITFTKGDSSTFAITVDTGSGGGTVPAGTVSSSAQILGYNIFATTGSNTFTSGQTIRSGGGLELGSNIGGGGSDNLIKLASLNESTLYIQNTSVSSGYKSGSVLQITESTGSNGFGFSGSAVFQMDAVYNGNSAGMQVGALNGVGSYVNGFGDTILFAKASGFPNTPATEFRVDAESIELSGSIKVDTGSSGSAGIVSVNGSLTVNNGLAKSNSIILATTQELGSGDEYPAVVSGKTNGSFTLSHNFGGSLNVAYLIINPI